MPLTIFDYDDENLLISINDRFDNIITIERDGSGNPTAIISPYGHRTELTIDDAGNLTNIQFEDSTDYSFAYTSKGLMTSKTDPRSLISTHVFDDYGRVIRTEDPENGIWILERNAYTDGSVNSTITSSEGNTKSHLATREPGGINRSISTYPDGDIKTIVRDNQGLDITQTECGVTNTIHYTLDAKLRRKIPEIFTTSTPASLTNQLKIAKSYVENMDGLTLTASTILNQNGKATSSVTNYQVGTRTVTSPVGRTFSSTFDKNNLLVTDREITGLLPTHFDYDVNGRLTNMTTGDRSILYNYDTRGNLEVMVDPLGRSTNYSYDLLDRVTQVDRPDGSNIKYQYDNVGNLTVLTTSNSADE